LELLIVKQVALAAENPEPVVDLIKLNFDVV
jgi:hypothetical protein